MLQINVDKVRFKDTMTKRPIQQQLHNTARNTLNNKMLQAFKGGMSDSVTNYNNVGNTKVSVWIKKTNANKCTLSDIFLTEILKSFSVI